MNPVGQLVLVLGLLVSAHCDVRARDPGVEEEEDVRGRGGEGRLMETPLMGGAGKSQTGYRLLTQLTNRRKQKVVTSLIRRCCPGCGGSSCEDKVSDPLRNLGGSGPGRSEVHHPGGPAGLQLQPQQADPNREQNDHYTSFSPQYEQNTQQNSTQPDQDPAHTHTYHHHRHYHQHNRHQASEHELSRTQSPDHVLSPHSDVHPVLPVPDMVVLLMSQLQPVLEGFNHSLEHLSRQVKVLVQDVADLKESHLREGSEGDQLDEVFQQIGTVQTQMEDQRRNMENLLHSQQALLHQNLSSFKMDVNLKLKHHQKLLQVSLQAMNATLTELKLDQDQNPDQQPEDQLPSTPLLHPDTPSETVALWEAITRLDNMVVNNTMKVGGLMEDVETASGAVEQLTQQLKLLDKQINETARSSQVLFMMTGLEVEQSRVSVQRQVEELAWNVTQHGQRLQEMDVDVDYLYTVVYQQNLSSDCRALKAAVAHLERGVANLTELANENRLALEGTGEGGGAEGGETSDWEPAVEALQHKVQQVEETLVSEQKRTRTLDLGVTQMSGSISALQELETKQEAQLKLLSASFRSLLEDAIRHSEVLQLLLGEEVLEFLEWTPQDQEAHSLPVLKEQLRDLQEQLRLPHETGDREEVPSADQPSSYLPSDWPSGGLRGSSRGGPLVQNQPLFLHPEMMQHAGDGSDLWNLEQKVEELQQRLVQLHENRCFCNNSVDREVPPTGVKVQLMDEVMWLKRELQEHLRVFKNVFSNADLLAATHKTLDLDKLWELMKRRDKKKRGRGGRKSRSRREEPGVFASFDQSDVSLLFVGGAPLKLSRGAVLFQLSQNRGQAFSDAGIFTVPVDGMYLFILTLDLRPGSVHVLLRLDEDRGGASVSVLQQEVTEAGLVSGMSFLLLREGEEVRLEVRSGEWVESEGNSFAGFLLHRIT